MKNILVVGTSKGPIVEAQRAPFKYYKKQLRKELNIIVNQVEAETFEEIAKVCENQNWDAAFLLPSWRESPQIAEAAVRSIRESNPKKGIFFIDPFAQVSSNYFHILPYVDRFLKRQRYKDKDKYSQFYAGGMMLTDYLEKEQGIELDGWQVSSNISKDYQDNIISGWSLGADKKYKNNMLQKSFLSWRPRKKSIDIFCRLSLGSDAKKEWYQKYRATAVKALEPLGKKYSLASSGGYVGKLVSKRQYMKELKSSRIVFSPFGWGESCWRDFEAICYDCLLVKPCMEHIDTQPNIFIANETYVPVKWDCSDLQEKIDFYLMHPEKMDAIVHNARKVYSRYFEQKEFIKLIKQLLEDIE